MASVAQKRITRDISIVTGANRELLEAQGIYYFPNEANISEGIALLVGQNETPYFGGYFFFAIAFPHDYPFSPISVTSLTQDGRTRFNPNMYLNGKVCLSVLNTWHDGPQWSGIQTLESVLLVIMSDVLNANPLENEPAFRGCGDSVDAVAYRRRIFHANLEMIMRMVTAPPPFAAEHSALMGAIFARNQAALVSAAEAVGAVVDGKMVTCHVFSMTGVLEFRQLAARLREADSGKIETRKK